MQTKLSTEVRQSLSLLAMTALRCSRHRPRDPGGAARVTWGTTTHRTSRRWWPRSSSSSVVDRGTGKGGGHDRRRGRSHGGAARGRGRRGHRRRSRSGGAAARRASGSRGSGTASRCPSTVLRGRTRPSHGAGHGVLFDLGVSSMQLDSPRAGSATASTVPSTCGWAARSTGRRPRERPPRGASSPT